MSYFGTALKLVLERRELPQRRIAELAEIDPSLFSRYLSGDVRPSRELLEKLCRSFAEPEDRAEVVIGHLKDETPASATELLQIVSLVNSGTNETPTPYAAEVKLPKKLKEDFEFLMKRSQSNPEVSDWITATVDVLRGR